MNNGGVASSASAAVTSSAVPPASAGLQSVVGSCDSYFGAYSCQVTRFPLEPGYVEIVQVDDVAGEQPSYFLKIVSDMESHVWVKHGDWPWQVLGNWGPARAGDDCIQPMGQQSAEATANIGQDAWRFCVR